MHHLSSRQITVQIHQSLGTRKKTTTNFYSRAFVSDFVWTIQVGWSIAKYKKLRFKTGIIQDMKIINSLMQGWKTLQSLAKYVRPNFPNQVK